jgi:HEAT repeat protein
VAVPALARLSEIDAKLVVPDLGTILQNADANVRSVGVNVLKRLPSPGHIALLGQRLNDDDPDVRFEARQALRGLARGDSRLPVIFAAENMLNTGQWRGLEQAIILLTELDHKPAVNRFLQLLRSDRPEVAITAAWGLRRLKVPETRDRVIDYVVIQMRPQGNQRKIFTDVIRDWQFSQLLQFLGQENYAPADSLFRQFIPKATMGKSAGPECRAAAIWALGRLHKGKFNAELAEKFEERLNDGSAIPPEVPQVRMMSAIALGQLGAKDAVPSLEKYVVMPSLSADPVSNGCAWALEQLTGKQLARPATIERVQSDWFLMPVR